MCQKKSRTAQKTLKDFNLESKVKHQSKPSKQQSKILVAGEQGRQLRWSLALAFRTALIALTVVFKSRLLGQYLHTEPLEFPWLRQRLVASLVSLEPATHRKIMQALLTVTLRCDLA